MVKYCFYKLLVDELGASGKDDVLTCEVAPSSPHKSEMRKATLPKPKSKSKENVADLERHDSFTEIGDSNVRYAL